MDCYLYALTAWTVLSAASAAAVSLRHRPVTLLPTSVALRPHRDGAIFSFFLSNCPFDFPTARRQSAVVQY